jgi:uncharacterized protein YxeA
MILVLFLRCVFALFIAVVFLLRISVRGVRRYQRGNQNPYIEEQTTQWPKEKVQKDKQHNCKKQSKNTTSEQHQNHIHGDKIDTLNTHICSRLLS